MPTALTVLGMGLALIAAWLWPPLAIAVVWPMLLVVPGWAVISWAAPRIAAPGRLGLAIVLSVAVGAHLAFWISIALGPLTGNLRVVRSGIGPNDRVIISGLQRARPGEKVVPKPGRIPPQGPPEGGPRTSIAAAPSSSASPTSAGNAR